VGLEDPILEDLLADVIADGVGRDRLLQYTEPVVDARRFRKDVELGDDGRGLVPLTPEEQVMAAWVTDHLSLPRGARVLDVARRYGVGVASVPAERLVVLWDGGEPGLEDDGMVSVREVVDPPDLPGLRVGQPALFEDSADRIAQSSQMLWSRPDADPRLQGLMVGGRAFKVQTWSGFFQSLDHERIARRILNGKDDLHSLQAFSERMGALLAGAHARGRTAAGNTPPAEAIELDLGRPGSLADELVLMTEDDLLRLHQDHARFVSARSMLGPLLGAERLR